MIRSDTGDSTKIYPILFSLYFFWILLFPAAGIWYIKEVLFIAPVALFFADVFLSNRSFDHAVFIRIISVYVIFAISLIMTGIYDSFSAESVGLVSAVFPLLLALVFASVEVDVLGIFLKTCVLFSVVVVIVAALMFLGPEAVVREVNRIYLGLNTGFSGYRDFGGVRIGMVHFRTSPILIIPLCFYAHNLFRAKNRKQLVNTIFAFLFIVLAIFFSASRGIMLFGYASVCVLLFFERDKKAARVALFLLLAAGVVGFFFLVTQTNVLSLSEPSNSVKFRHLLSFFDHMDEHPLEFLFGGGLGSEYYSSGSDRIVWQTELTFIDMVRYFGIFGALALVALFAVPFERGVAPYLIVPFVFYLINAMTNPLVFNSTGIAAITVYWAVLRRGDTREHGGRLAA